MERFEEVPPSSNTGVLNTWVEPLRACIDWVQGTFSYADPPERVAEYMGLPWSLFVQQDRAEMGYMKAWRFGHITIFAEGSGENMGTHFRITGQGCREFEQSSNKLIRRLFY